MADDIVYSASLDDSDVIKSLKNIDRQIDKTAKDGARSFEKLSKSMRAVATIELTGKVFGAFQRGAEIIQEYVSAAAEAQAAQAVGLNYAQVQQLEAMRDAAQNEGGGAGLGMGLGAGMGFGNMMAGAMASNMGQQGGQPGQQPQQADPMEKLKKLKEMLEADLISEEEYAAKKKEILDSM